MKISIPKLSLVVLIGPSGSGKSTFARRHFLPTEVISSDYCRGLVSDDENDQSVTTQAFDVLHYVARHRLALGRLAVIDATNVQPESRRPLVQLAREQHCLPVAIVFNLPEQLCQERNRLRPDRAFGPHVVRQQRMQLRRSIKRLKQEGFRYVVVFESPEEVEQATLERVPLWNDKREVSGPFDIIGDLHGCGDELEELLQRLGYQPVPRDADDSHLWGSEYYVHPAGRQAIFVGDLVDRGNRVLDCVRIVRNMVIGGSAICVPGNHDVKLLKKLRGKDVQITHGLETTLAEIESLAAELRPSFCAEAAKFIDSLVSHYVFDGGKLVVAHAGMKQEMQGRASPVVRDFALYGATTGETDEFGLPVRLKWAADYRGSALVVYGHTPVVEPEWLNNTVNIDTGCVFGGMLTALRYPEREMVSVPARQTYCVPSKPFLPVADLSNGLSTQQQHDDVLDAADVLGKRIVHTGLLSNVTIREENAMAALEVMSRFAANPKWLVYLPPTMSPSETTMEPGLLEHPAEAFGYFRRQRVQQVVCEEKHMGSRAVVVVCRDEQAARERFGVTEGETGIIYTRTGRRFFDNRETEQTLLNRLATAMSAAGIWDQLKTNWACLDCELMPWSAKAQELLRQQYAAVGSAGRGALPQVLSSLEQAVDRLSGEPEQIAQSLLGQFSTRETSIRQFIAAYRQYCWTVNSIDDLKLAPFHLLATEGKVHSTQLHTWHMELLHSVADQDPGVLLATKYHSIDLQNPASEAEGIAWWQAMTDTGGEGMVVKPLDFIVRGSQGLVQPALKCRGREYLRIIYGPDYTAEENLTRLRKRGLGLKRSLAMREFALGMEGLERFVNREPLRRVHECVFGVLALESEPVDPRL
jgi:protein phosphatase